MKLFDSERDFTRWVLGEARARGWKATHLETHMVVRTPGGLRAVPSRDATGFPDCVFVHPVFGFFLAELKMPRSKGPARELSEPQVAWIIALRAAGQTVYVWYPHEQDEILEVLEGRVPSGHLFGDEVEVAT